MVRGTGSHCDGGMGHFRMVLQEMDNATKSWGRQRKDEYVNKLLEFKKRRQLEEAPAGKAAHLRPHRSQFLRALACFPAHQRRNLRGWYHKFMVRSRALPPLSSTLLKRYHDEDKVRQLEGVIEREAEIMDELELWGIG